MRQFPEHVINPGDLVAADGIRAELGDHERFVEPVGIVDDDRLVDIMETAPLFAREIGAGVVTGDADDINHIVAGVVHQRVIPFKVGQGYVVWIPDPQHIVDSGFIEQLVEVTPDRLVNIGILAGVHRRIPAPVAIHFVVEAEQYRMAEFLQSPGIFPEILVILPVENVVHEILVSAVRAGQESIDRVGVCGLHGEFDKPAVGEAGPKARQGNPLIQRLIAENEPELVAETGFQLLDLPQTFGGDAVEIAPAQWTGLAEIFGLKRLGFLAQLRFGRGWLAEDAGSAAPLGQLEAVQDLQIVVDGLGRLDEDGIGLIRGAQHFQAGIMVAIARNGRQRGARPFDAVDGKTVPLESFPDGDMMARRRSKKFVGVVHIVARIGHRIGEVVGVDFDPGGAGTEGTAHCRQGKFGGQVGGDANGIAVGMICNSLITGQGRAGGDFLHVIQGFAGIGAGGPTVDVKRRRRNRLGGFRCSGRRNRKDQQQTRQSDSDNLFRVVEQ